MSILVTGGVGFIGSHTCLVVLDNVSNSSPETLRRVSGLQMPEQQARLQVVEGDARFCWALKTYGGNEDLHRDSCHALYKSPGTLGWNSIAIFPKTDRQFYGQTVLHVYSGDRFGGLPSAINSSIDASGHQLRSGIPVAGRLGAGQGNKLPRRTVTARLLV